MEIRIIVSMLIVTSVHYVRGYYFNYYVFAAQWPASFCFDDNLQTNTSYVKHVNRADHCLFAQNISTWTIHGLWPSVNESYPNFCNSSWKLNESDFSKLEDAMRAFWPSFGGKGQDFEFWDHEWSKHGTCASNITFLRGPYNYFKFALQLNKQLDLLTTLSTAAKIIPGENHCYSYAQVHDGIQKRFDESVILGCTFDNNTGTHHLAQIEFCYDKQFKMTCNPTMMSKRKPGNLPFNRKRGDLPEVNPCPKHEKICYYNIKHANNNQ